ncbi:hydantoinase/oxoprolinase family protein [Desulfoscipio gibsoniae]
MTKYKLAVDTGGTFTDFCLLGDNGRLLIAKEPSTPDDPSRAVLEGIKKIASQQGIRLREINFILHGTTVATNAILEQKGARTALITTRGFRDIIFIGRQNRPHLYNFWAQKPAPLLPRHMVLEIEERILADGSVKTRLGKEDINNLIEQLRQSGAESAAVCLLHAYANPEHEIIIKEALRKELPHLSITISSEILPEFREYERTSTTVINALVKPKVDRYVSRLAQNLRSAGVESELFIMQSNGGVITAPQARQQSARTVLSGPAGGVLAGVYIARQTGHNNLLTADIGGTSMDICLIHRQEPRFTTEGSIGGHPLRLPMLDIHTIGAGGGSIAWIDTGGALRVGPRSAGSIPGPACYNLGGHEPTVTDANMVLGRLTPEDFAGLDNISTEMAARHVDEKIGRPLGLTPEAAAEGVIKVVNANMVRAMRVISVQRGFDPRDFTLVPFGGAGPLQAVELAREMGIPRILIPPHPGVTSAWGMLSADVRHDYSITHVTDLAPDACPGINAIYDDLAKQGSGDLTGEGFDKSQINLSRFMDLRYRGQSYELTIAIPDNELIGADLLVIGQRFHRRHLQHYGYCREKAAVEIVTLRLAATGRLPKLQPRTRPSGELPGSSGTRRVYMNGSYHDVPVYERRLTGPGWRIQGPAVVTQTDTTTLIWPGNNARCDRWGNIIIETGVR